MFESDVWRCGAVDVSNGTGLIRRGTIKDLDDSGDLIIDFGYPDHRADHISPRQCTIPSRVDPYKTGDKVETLYQRNHNQAWYWYPSCVLSGTWLTTTTVEIDFGDGNVVHKDLAPERIRGVISMDTIRKFTFVKNNVSLSVHKPELRDLVKKAMFLDMWSFATGTIGVKVERDTLTYISMDGNALTERECTDYLRRLSKLPFHRGTKRTADVLDAAGESTSSKKDTCSKSLPCINLVLDRSLIAKIFKLLPVEDQTNCRQVCRFWNRISRHIPKSPRITVDLDNRTKETLESALRRMITESTETLVLLRSHPTTPLHLVWNVLKNMKIKLPQIILSSGGIWADDLLEFGNGPVRFQSEWSKVCRRLVLETINVHGLFEAHKPHCATSRTDKERSLSRRGKHIMGSVLHVVKGVVEVNGRYSTKTVLNILEKVCPGVDERHWTALREISHTKPSRRLMILWAMQRWQLGDNRFGTADEDWWQLDLDTVNRNSLRKLTVLALRWLQLEP